MACNKFALAVFKFLVDFCAFRLFYFLTQDLPRQLRRNAPKLHRVNFHLKRLAKFRACMEPSRGINRNLCREIPHNVDNGFRYVAPYFACVKVNLHRDIGIRAVNTACRSEQCRLDCINENMLRQLRMRCVLTKNILQIR